jgi:NAD(P)-dependent dehydrogenase (short-subunit alcohol dehydrogenase family)
VPRYELKGKVALITGGARGIGFATAEALARRGASIVVVDLNQDRVAAAAERLGSARAMGIAADVRDAAALDRVVSAAVGRFGGLDVVVANAGVAPPAGSVRTTPSAEYERVLGINLLGVYRTMHATLEQIVARRGQAVLISSIYAFANGSLASPYAVAKAGVEQLGRALRVELAAHGASATVAYFGWVDTRLVQDAFEERRRIRGREEDMFPAFLLKRITPEQAGEALARGIERRQARVLAPRWWAGVAALRGMLGPLMDYAGARSTKVLEEVRAIEALRPREPSADGRPAPERALTPGA